MLTESVLLAMVGGAAGLYVAYVGTRAILVLAFRGANYIPIDVRPSLPVLGFSILLSLITGIVFGILPAWTASQYHPSMPCAERAVPRAIALRYCRNLWPSHKLHSRLRS